MKKRILTISLVATWVVAMMMACENGDQEASPDVRNIPTDNTPIIDVMKTTPIPLATIRKGNFELQFIGLGYGDVVMLERNNGAGPGILEKYEGSNAFTVFTALTDNNVSVPAMIASTAEKIMVANSKRVTDQSNKHIVITDESYVHPTSTKTAACSDPGKDAFEDASCESPVVSTPTNIEFCDAGNWTHLIRSSFYDGDWRKVNRARTVTYSCGSVRVKFYLFNNNAWELFHQVDFQPGKWIWTRSTGTAYYLRVERISLDNNIPFRAFTRFTKD